MKPYRLVVCTLPLLLAASLWGCSSSREASGQDQGTTPQVREIPPPPGANLPAKPPVKADTISVEKQSTERPVYQSQTPPPPAVSRAMPVGKFSVQVGAYKMPDNADRIVALAKERFAKNVYMYQDNLDNLYKVLIGDFASKDEARRFRDEMAQQYPADYKDAWVSENLRK
jgi:cell division septation protein DedD